ncbi:hypothetical protein ACFJIV_12070 [Mucilaginibacter sp. UC70_90]
MKTGYPQFSYHDFRTKSMTGYKIKHLDSLVQGIDICVIPEKNILLILEIRDKYYIKAYDLTTLKYLKAFINKGPGLNQQLSCRSIQYMDGFLYSSDTHKKKIFIYNTDDIIKPGVAVLPIDEINVNSKFFYRPLILPQRLALQFHQIIQDKKTPVFDYFDKSGAFLYSKGSYPQLGKKIDFDNLSYAYMGSMNLSNDHQKIMVDYFNTDILELYDIQGNLINRLQGPDQLFPEIKSEAVYGGSMPHLSKDSHRAYTGKVKSLDGEFFVLYSGKIATDPDIHTDKLFSFNGSFSHNTIISCLCPFSHLISMQKVG